MNGTCYTCARLLSEPSRGCSGPHVDRQRNAARDLPVEPAPLGPVPKLPVYENAEEVIEVAGLITWAQREAKARGQTTPELIRRALTFELGDPESNGRASVVLKSSGPIPPGCSEYLQVAPAFLFKPLQFVCDDSGFELNALHIGNKIQWPWMSVVGKPLPSEHFAGGAKGSKVQSYSYDTCGYGIAVGISIVNKNVIDRSFTATLFGRRAPEATE
jgi:hypothetical protein